MNRWIQRAVLRLKRIETRFFRLLVRRAPAEKMLRTRILKQARRLGRFYFDGNSDIVGFTYHPIPFDGFEHVPHHRGSCEKRLNAILNQITISPGDWVLDLGANVGFYAFSLARLGAIVEAYESNCDTFEIGASLSNLYKCDVIYVNKPISVANLKYLRPHYKIILLLSIFHWIVKQEGRQGAIAILRDLAVRGDFIFFEVPSNPDDAMYKHPLFSSLDSVKTFITSTLPDAEIKSLEIDSDWMDRVIWQIDCRQVSIDSF